MSEPLKLKNPGESVTIVVKSCTKLTFGQYPEFEFVGRDGSKVRVPEVSALRQLGNLELTPESIVGRRVTIKRDANAKQPAKPYWGIYLEGSGAKVTGGAANGAAVGTTQPPAAPAPAAPAKPEKDSALYLRMTEFVLTDVRNLYETHGYEMPADVAAAITATLYINAKGR